MLTLTGPYNPELMKMLNEFSTWFMMQPHIDTMEVNGKPDPNGWYVSKEYLFQMQAKDPKTDKTAQGHPNHTHGIDLIQFNHKLPEHMQQPCKDINKKLNSWFGSKFCAVMMYYPPDGFMDWHTNCNCAGYNTLITYSHTGASSFTWQDPISEQFIIVPDKRGWSIKTGYFGRHDEPNDTIWHSAETQTHRITFGYVIPDKNMWKMMSADMKDMS